MSRTLRAADAGTLHLWDGIVLFWVVLWAVLGVWSGVTIWQVADTGDTITSSGEALHSAGTALESLSDVPVIGERPGRLGAEVVVTADEITGRGQQIKGQLRRLGLLLGLAIMAIPVSPVVGVYLPLRLSRRREVARIRRQLAERPDDRGLDRYLADRARTTLSFDLVAEAVRGPADEHPDRQVRRLADAELARLGLTRPARA